MRIATLIGIVSGGCIATGIVWLALGSRILILIDRCFPGRPSAKQTGDLLIEGDRFSIGSRWYPLSGSRPFQVLLDSQQRLVFCSDGRSFTFGPVQKIWPDPVKPQYLFVPATGDAVSFTRDVSRLSWQTPFAFSVMPSFVPKWHRYAYDRLRWTKQSGSMLEIVWRDQQSYYPGQWADSNDSRLIDIGIQLGPSEIAAAAYLAATKGWAGSEYRLEPQSATAEDDIFAVIHRTDEMASHPGGGKSIILRVNRSSRKVVGETGLQ